MAGSQRGGLISDFFCGAALQGFVFDVQGTAQGLEHAALLAGEVFGYFDVNSYVEVSGSLPVDAGKAVPAQTKDRAGLRALGNFQTFRAAECRHLDFGPKPRPYSLIVGVRIAYADLSTLKS